MLTRTKMPDLTILNGQAASNIIRSKEVYSDADVIIIHAPTVLDPGTYVIEVTGDENATSSSVWRVLQIGDPFADATPPPINKSRAYYELSTCAAFRIKNSSQNVTADRTWGAEKSFSL